MLTTATPVWPRLDLGTHRFTARGTASCDATCAAESHETASLAAARRPFHLARQHGTLHRVSAFVDRIPHAQVAFAMARVEVDLASPEAKSSHAWAAVRTRLGRRGATSARGPAMCTYQQAHRPRVALTSSASIGHGWPSL